MNFMKSVLKIAFILFINIATLYYSSCYSEKLHDVCLMNENCKCPINGSVYSNKIDCSYKNSLLTIEVFPEKISFECKNLLSQDIMKLMPDLGINGFVAVFFDNCTLPENLTIAAILHKLSVTNCKKLRFSNKLATNITKHNLMDLHGLEDLEIVTDSINEDLFSDKSLTSLTSLKLFSYLNVLPQNVFANFKNLRTLYIGPIDFISIRNKVNQLVLTKHLFKPVEHLKVLNLEYNVFDKFEPDLLEFLKNLEDIDLSCNKFKSLPEGIFKTNTNLKSFRLSANLAIIKIPSYFLANLPKLDIVFLDGGLKSIPENIFVNSTHIKSVSFTYNNILKDLPAKIFANLRMLLILDLSFNGLNYLPNNLFQDNHKLKKLMLSGNNLKQITSDHFLHLKCLEYLDISYNRLTFESLQFTKSFKNLSNIKELYLQSNDIEQMPINIPSGINILDLSDNIITIFNYNEISDTNLNDIEINLSYNRIRYVNVNNISMYAYRILKHQTIDLNNNPILCDCYLKEFKKIIDFKEETKLTFRVENLRCEEPWNLSDRKLTEISLSALQCETTLKHCPIKCNCFVKNDLDLIISCTNAQLTSVPNLSIIPINNLINISNIILNLENNYIKQLPFSETILYANVTRLYLKNNHLKNIDSSQLPKYLTTLDVTQNQLTTFNNETLKFMNANKLLQFIYLTDNPWTCDCMATYIIKFLQGKSLSLSNLTCAEPEYLKGKRFYRLKPQTLLCPLNTPQCPIKCSCGIRSYDQILIVNCSNALLTSVPNLPNIDIFNLTGIVLNLENNHIQELPLHDTRGYANVTKLFLANNILKNIDKSQLPKNLIELDVKRNQLKFLNIETLRYINESSLLQYINLLENPWICDCNAKLQLRLMPRNSMLLKYVNVTCASKLQCQLETRECPKKCNCFNKNSDSIIIINCSNSQLLTVPDLQPITRIMNLFKLNEIELNLENNYLIDLPMANTIGYENVTKLFLAGNNFVNITSFQLPSNLTDLNMQRNELTSLNNEILMFFKASKFLQHVYLSENPWKCDCADLSLLNFMQQTQLVVDFEYMNCADKSQIKYFHKLQELCFDRKQFYVILVMGLFAIGLLLALIAAFYYKYQEEVKIWLYAQGMCLWFVTEQELDRNKTYDAFVSYSHRDEDFIYEYLIPGLESGSPAFKLCIDERDWLIGSCIPDQIHKSIANSRRTIVVLSQNFIESMWARMEFKAAHKSALDEGRSRIIVIIYDDIVDIDSLDDDLKLYLKMNLYLKWGQPRFWNKLRYAMPHISRNWGNEIALNEIRPINNTVLQ